MISFFTTGIRYHVRGKQQLKKWFTKVAGSEGKKIGDLNIILCSDEFLYDLNVQYLQHHTYTDIITFDHNVSDVLLSGELYISMDRVRENAVARGIPIQAELHRVMVHGLLHLCGYGDRTKVQKSKMSILEDKYLAHLKLV
jgi:probable rRNA maturation factor